MTEQEMMEQMSWHQKMFEQFGGVAYLESAIEWEMELHDLRREREYENDGV